MRRFIEARTLRAPAPPKPVNLPQCDAIRQERYANDRPETDRRCRNTASIAISGKNYCRKHAGVVALSILLNEGKGR